MISIYYHCLNVLNEYEIDLNRDMLEIVVFVIICIAT